MSGSAVDRALELGTKYFKIQDYKNARNVFSKTVKLIQSCNDEDTVKFRESLGLTSHTFTSSNGKPKKIVVHPRYIKLLDNLSATWEKMNELSKALKVADKMIEKESYNLKGYIRRGILLQKLGKEDDAYKNYKMALKMANYGHDSLKMDYSPKFLEFVQNKKRSIKENMMKLKREKSNLERKRVIIDPIEEHKQIKKSKVIQVSEVEENVGIDFINDLPMELLPYILSGFKTSELFRLMTVSKAWCKRIRFWSVLFNVFNLRRVTYKEFSQFIIFIQKISSSRYSSIKDLTNPDIQYDNKHFIKSITLSSRLPSEEKKMLNMFFMNLQNYSTDKLIVSTVQASIYELSKYVIPDDTFCRGVKDLSIITMLRADKPGDVEFLSNFQSLNNLELIFNGSLVPVTSSFNSNSNLTNSRILSLNPAWSSNLRSLRIICDQNRVKSFPMVSFLLANSPLNWSSLNKLCISGVTFDDTVIDFRWLLQFQNVEDLWLENNRNGRFASFLKLLKENHVFKNLRSLTFREDINNGRCDVDVTDSSSMYKKNFQNINILDLMNTCISGSGLYNLTSFIDTDILQKLNIGFCSYIGFSKQSHINDLNNISTEMRFFERMKNLKELDIQQMGSLTDNSVSALIEQIWYLNNLTKLDLSFNQSIGGSSVFDLVRAIIKNNGNKPLHSLMLNGCPSVSHVTVNMMRSKKLVTNMECVYERESWERFGVNSFKYRI
ncbi:similar to Saccharomyces cerevisiae YOR080W DIA2 Origin-binding F-box protein [Maudiozyma barnettii]|uniref:Similar to Saccharomyces cerevisiae YOR080W DIA2 Origin-binding F-box protein n=1 Tax=Maudiozyma barnettii TaxID=61262 RepID=A0A8H2VJ15_9SACH|nr:DNA-binding SCF ubiquitin ligase subunit DIA2 [Kazachstania barnettii]CAB4256260.1 similar to Saccharomyces cerevisiae YOR080W DIA2 Origin-binding F-box protein [Kazachstania barnettii]CAD1784869.1 similar to Saccharomyces cerevisiae YOR080W DIA2 Origin-binding F-box protein [Kazachstania barnettii]